MKNQLLIQLFLICITPILTHAQGTQIFEREYKYQASEDDGRNQAREKARKEAQALLLEEVGIIVESRTELIEHMSDGQTYIDFQKEINIYTLGKVNTTIIPGTEKWDGHTYFAKFSMEIDTTALYAHLNSIIEQKQKVYADSMAKARKVSELELTIRTAKNLLASEQEREKPLKIEKDKKERELKEAELQKYNAQRAFDNARNAIDAYTDIGAQRIENERKLLQAATNNLNNKSAEYNFTDKNWQEANSRVEAARRNLQSAENNLAREMNIAPVKPDYAFQSTTWEPPPSYTKPSEHRAINIGLGGMLNFIFLDDAVYKDTNTEKDTTKNSFSYSVGLITGISFTSWMAIYSEFYFTSKTFRNNQCSRNCTKIEEYSLDIPLLIKLSTGDLSSNSGKAFGAYFEAGVQFGIPLSTTIYTSETYIEREKKDFGFLVGLGMSPNPNVIDFGFRFGFNISNFAKDVKGSFGTIGIILRIGAL